MNTQKSDTLNPPIKLDGALYAIIATIMWSGNFIVARGMTGYVPPITLGFLRWVAAIIILLPFCYKELVAAWPIIKKYWYFYLGSSLAGVSLFTILMYSAALSTSVLNMTLIATSTPVLTIILARIFLGENFTVNRIIGIVLAVAGVTVLATRGKLSNLLGLEFHTGDILVLCSAICFAINNILMRTKPRGPSLNAYLSTIFILGMIVTLPLTVWELSRPGVHIVWNGKVWISIVYLGLLASVGGFWFWNKAIISIGAGNAALFYYSLPFFGGLGAVILLSEPVLWVHWVSGILIIIGILIATRR